MSILARKVRVHDVMERWDLVKSLREIPERELGEILKTVTPRVAVIIIDLMRRFGK